MLSYKKINYKKKAPQGMWRPKYRWLASVTISLDGSKRDKHCYYTPKSAEEERIIEKDFNERMDRVFDPIFSKVLEDFVKDNKNNNIKKSMELILLPVKPFQETLFKSMCGPASLKMVFDYYGVEKSEEEIAKLAGTIENLGTDEAGIKKAAESFGFKVIIKNESSFEDIQSYLDKKIPVIVNWFTRGRIDYDDSQVPDGHYSVVVGLDNDHIYLQDPEIGKLRKIAKEDFMKVWFDFKGEAIKPDELIIRQLIAIWK